MLLHRFEQRTLHFGGCTVNLVGEHQIRENRPLARVEGTVLRAVDQCADDVCWQQVGGELNALEVGVGGGGKCADAQRLRQSGDALEEHVPIRQ